MRWFWAVVFLALTASACRAQQPAGKCSPAYQNNNIIDYGPLVFRNLSGYDIDPASARMAGAAWDSSPKRIIDWLQPRRRIKTATSHSPRLYRAGIA
jgi:hypothetical protein